MNKFKALLLIGLVLVGVVKADVESTFNDSSSGTTSATVFVPNGGSPANITALSTRFDAGVTTGLVIIRPGQTRYTINSAIGSGAVVWFANSSTQVALDDFIIFFDESDTNGDPYTLHEVVAATTTSVTVNPNIGVAATTSDLVWHVPKAQETVFPANNSASTATASINPFVKVEFWAPGNAPTAVTIDGNTTSCRIAISGVRSQYR